MVWRIILEAWATEEKKTPQGFSLPSWIDKKKKKLQEYHPYNLYHW